MRAPWVRGSERDLTSGRQRPSTVRSDEWPVWFSFWFSGCWQALAKGTAWAFFLSCNSSSSHPGAGGVKVEADAREVDFGHITKNRSCVISHDQIEPMIWEMF